MPPLNKAPQPGPTPVTPNADISDAIGYVKADPGGALTWLRWLGGLIVALLKRPAPKL